MPASRYLCSECGAIGHLRAHPLRNDLVCFRCFELLIEEVSDEE